MLLALVRITNCYTRVLRTAVDAQVALARANERLAEQAERVAWLEGRLQDAAGNVDGGELFGLGFADVLRDGR